MKLLFLTFLIFWSIITSCQNLNILEKVCTRKISTQIKTYSDIVGVKIIIDGNTYKEGNYSCPIVVNTDRVQTYLSIESEAEIDTSSIMVSIGSSKPQKLAELLPKIQTNPIKGSKGTSAPEPQDIYPIDSKKYIPIVLQLNAGINKIGITLKNANDKIVNKHYYVKYKPMLYIVGIGIAQYEDTTKNLRSSDTDVRKIGNWVSKSVDNDEYDIDSTYFVNESAIEDNIKKHLRNITSKTRKMDKVLIVFSGHGEIINKSFNFCLYNRKPTYNDWYKGAVSCNEVLETLASDAQIVLIIDACYSGNATDAMSVNQFFKRNENNMIIAASETEAYETREYGILSKVLIDNMQNKKLNLFSKMLLNDPIRTQLQNEVNRIASKIGIKQKTVFIDKRILKKY